MYHLYTEVLHKNLMCKKLLFFKKLSYLESSKLTVLCHISQGYIHNTLLTKLEKCTISLKKFFLSTVI